jgi:hypothetical protein
MQEYAHAAEEMRESIIDAYLRKHPDVPREHVVTKMINGRLVVDQIKNVLNSSSGKAQVTEIHTKSEKKLIAELRKGGDERLAHCVRSIENSKGYIDWLFNAKFTGFSESDKNDNVIFLQNRQQICEDKALDLYNVKMKLAEMMNNSVKPSPSMVKTLTAEYLQSVLGQLKSQHGTYKKEVTLGDHFSDSMKDFLKKEFGQVKEMAKPSTLKACQRAFMILQKENINITDIASKGKLNELSTSLDRLGDQLQDRKKELELIQKMVTSLEQMLEQIEKKVAEREERSTAPSGPRMVFTSRKDGGRRR